MDDLVRMTTKSPWASLRSSLFLSLSVGRSLFSFLPSFLSSLLPAFLPPAGCGSAPTSTPLFALSSPLLLFSLPLFLFLSHSRSLFGTEALASCFCSASKTGSRTQVGRSDGRTRGRKSCFASRSRKRFSRSLARSQFDQLFFAFFAQQQPSNQKLSGWKPGEKVRDILVQLRTMKCNASQLREQSIIVAAPCTNFSGHEVLNVVGISGLQFNITASG